MPLVIADTSPINYLILIEHIDLLPRLFERVVIPGTVLSELSSHDAPPAVHRWIADPPAWLEMIDTSHVGPFAGLHKGESAAIATGRIGAARTGCAARVHQFGRSLCTPTKDQFQKPPRVVGSHAGPQCQTKRIVVAELRELWAQPKHGSSSAKFKQPSL